MGRGFGVSNEVVRNFGYGLLALFLEVVTLGAISLVKSIRCDDAVADKKFDDSTEPESLVDDFDLRRKIVNLSNDIIRGQM